VPLSAPELQSGVVLDVLWRCSSHATSLGPGRLLENSHHLVCTLKPRGLPYESLASTSTARSRRVQASTSPLAQRLYPRSEAGRYCVSGLETSVAASALLLRRFLE
jgi:hypothetical protein